ncbi:MAG TPA: aldehyde dehydrogenase family protein, partial [Sphingobium sp.]
MVINGKTSVSADWIDVINPATEQVIGRVPDCTARQLDEAVAASRAAFPLWRDTPYAERQAALAGIAGKIMDSAEELHHLLTAEQGKPLADALFELHAAAWWIGEIAKNELPVTVTDAMP